MTLYVCCRLIMLFASPIAEFQDRQEVLQEFVRDQKEFDYEVRFDGVLDVTKAVDIEFSNWHRQYLGGVEAYLPGDRLDRIHMFGGHGPNDDLPDAFLKIDRFPELTEIRVHWFNPSREKRDVIINMPNLKDLGLSLTRFTIDEILSLKSAPKLRNLNISGMKMTPRDFAKLIERFPKLNRLSIRNVGVDESWETSADLKDVNVKLGALGIGVNRKFTRAPFALLRNKSATFEIRSLSVEYGGIGDEEFDAIKRIRGLENLNLTATRVAPSVPERLGELKGLRRLDFTGVPLSARTINKLLSQPQMVQLRVAVKESHRFLIQNPRKGQEVSISTRPDDYTEYLLPVKKTKSKSK